jgi:LacI family transcriptional regulator
MATKRQHLRSKPPHVAVCVDQFRSHGRGVMIGIAKYVEIYGPWSLFIDPLAESEYPKGRSANWHGEGVLTYIEKRQRAQRLRDSAIPTVELFATRQDGLLPVVAHDDAAAGSLAAEHLLERHFRHFAYCGDTGSLWSERREQGFRETLTRAGCVPPQLLSIRRPRTLAEWEEVQQRLMAWVRDVRKPAGLMCCSDQHAQLILDACQRANLSVPEELAVIGVDNDEEICRLTNPPLTSVILNSEKVGYEGAKLLDGLMKGNVKARGVKPVFIPPLGVLTRRSTDVTAINDPLIAQAARLIRERGCEGIRLEELLRAFGTSRSVFYQRFHDALGRSPHYEILRVKLERVKGLLRQTSLPLKQIAELAGFSNPNYLNVAFKRELGVTPREFRRHQNGS